MTKILAWLVMIPVTALVVAFAISNRQPTTLDFWPLPFVADVPVYFAVLLAALIGFLLGGLITWLSAVRRTRRKVKQVKTRAAEERQALRARLEDTATAGDTGAAPAVVSETPKT